MRNLLILVGIALAVTGVFSIVNFTVFSSGRILPFDAFFLEGVMFVIFGLLLFLGKGGIDLFTLKGAMLSAWAEALFGADTPGPNEMFQRDAWKPDGFIRLSLILILTGVFMLLIYFLKIFVF
jgi:hypothetical protein